MKFLCSATALCLSVLAFHGDTYADHHRYHQVIRSVSANKRTKKLELSSKDIAPQSPVEWKITKTTLRGGKQEGVELITIDNGKLVITVIPTRGMGVLSVKSGDVTLGWDSPVKEIVHPRHVNLESRGGLGWLEGFSEWMCRCGLESNGGPGEDKFINNVGDEATMNLTLHGKIANIPAQEVEVLIDKEAPFRIRIRGRVDEKMFYGPKLELQTEISTVPGSSEFQIADHLTNVGASEQEYEVLYHANYGTGLLEGGATFEAPIKKLEPINATAAKAIGKYNVYKAPTLGFIEEVFLIYPYADSKDRTMIMLQNKAKDRAVSMAWSIKELPYLTVWKNTAALKDGYVTGIEPGTNFPNNRRVERKFGRVPKLKAGETVRMAIDFGIYVGGKDVQSVSQAIKKIQADRGTTIQKEPTAEP